jgi:hypothetical protein
MRLMLALVASAMMSTQQAAPAPQVPGPDATEPEHATLALEAQGNGVQIYTCTAQDAALSWVLTAPEASLIDPTGDEIGSHSAGPTWTFKDGSSVTGKVLKKQASPEAGSIPWLLLAAKVTPGHPGQADRIAFVRRYNTHGGLPPDSGCDAEHAAKTARVPYTATYAFYTTEAK